MTPPTGPARGSSFLRLRHALADRATRPADADAPPDALDAQLRVVIARVLRTGRGPAAVVRWVGRQVRHTPPPADGDPADHLAGRLRRLLPDRQGVTQPN